jgi:hypothetical protein
VNTNGTGNTQIATGAQLGSSNFVQDLALEPGGTSVLVSTTDNGQIFRIDLGTNAVSLVSSPGAGLRGITYDNAGNLFAVVTGNVVEQIDPTTGAVLNSLAVGGGTDGITFDPFTGNLFVAQGSNILELPTSLASTTSFTCGVCSFIDGLESDGNGNIDLADSSAGNIAQYNITGNTFAVVAGTPGIDDLAPVTGLGAPHPSVPEPTSLLLLGSVVSLISLRLRKKFAS